MAKGEALGILLFAVANAIRLPLLLNSKSIRAHFHIRGPEAPVACTRSGLSRSFRRKPPKWDTSHYESG